MKPTVIRNEQRGTREGRNGRLYDSTIVTWFVVLDGVMLGEYDRKSDAVALANRPRGKPIVRPRRAPTDADALRADAEWRAKVRKR